jgi:hypothetical protein
MQGVRLHCRLPDAPGIFCGGVVVDALRTAGGPDSLMRSQNIGPEVGNVLMGDAGGIRDLLKLVHVG